MSAVPATPSSPVRSTPPAGRHDSAAAENTEELVKSMPGILTLPIPPKFLVFRCCSLPKDSVPTSR